MLIRGRLLSFAEGKYRLSRFPLDSYLGLPPEAIDLLQGEEQGKDGKGGLG